MMVRPLIFATLTMLLGAGIAESSTRKAPAHKPPTKELKGKRRLRGKLRVARGVVKKRLTLVAADRSYSVLGQGVVHRELSRLNNHQLELVGRLMVQGKKRSFKATGYTIIEVRGGRRPEVGWIEAKPSGGLLLSQRDRQLSLAGSKAMLRRLKKRAGCKVWAVGTLSDTRLEVTKFGWINCTDKAPIRRPKKEKKR